MIYQSTERPFDVQAQFKSLMYHRITETNVYGDHGILGKRFPCYKPVGPTILVEWGD